MQAYFFFRTGLIIITILKSYANVPIRFKSISALQKKNILALDQDGAYA